MSDKELISPVAAFASYFCFCFGVAAFIIGQAKWTQKYVSYSLVAIFAVVCAIFLKIGY